MQSADGSRPNTPDHDNSTNLQFREIFFGTDEYRLECRLREEVLRRPLGLSLNDEDLTNEESELHFGLFESCGNLVACVIATPRSHLEAKIRQMAVSPCQQRKGLGQKIMTDLERNLFLRGIKIFSLNARSSAVGFYKKLGYTAVGSEFIEITIPHFKMVKRLQSTDAFEPDSPDADFIVGKVDGLR